jgi:hypothetical protein
MQILGTSSSCWGGENPLKSSCKGGSSRSRYTKESQPRNGDKSILRRKKQPCNNSNKTAKRHRFSLSLSLSVAHTAWNMEQQAEGDMHNRRARKLVDQANGCDSHYCMWRVRNKSKRGKGSREGERRERQETQREEKENSETVRD